MLANGHGIIAVTGRAHCQRQIAFFCTSAEKDTLISDLLRSEPCSEKSILF